MRFGTLDGRFVVVRDGFALDVHRHSEGHLRSDALGAIDQWDEVLQWERTADWSRAVPVADADLGPPVPTPRQVFAVALNYRPHAFEAGFQPPAAPLIFTKFPTCIAGPVTCVQLPPGNVDWEIEVVVVIGRGGHSIPSASAWDAVAGLTVGQDLSERLTQLSGTPAQFSLGKSYPGFGPTGPVAVTPDEFVDRNDIGFECLLGDDTVQQGRTSEMIFPIDELVARISAVCPLLPGDLIFTGTPSGVGNRRNPPRFLHPGDNLVSRVEQIGEIRQTFEPAFRNRSSQSYDLDSSWIA